MTAIKGLTSIKIKYNVITVSLPISSSGGVMQKWEYIIITAVGRERFLEALNEAGKQGWRACMETYGNNGEINIHQVFAEREIQKSPKSK